MTLRLRCIRCGEWDEMDALDCFSWGLCAACDAKEPPSHPDYGRYRRWNARWQRGMEFHPTYKALTAALEEMAAIPHGTLAEPLPSSGS